MQNNKTPVGLGALLFGLSFMLVSTASAMIPTITVQNTNDDNYLLNISGDANYATSLYYHNASNPNVYSTLNLGNTNSSGYLQYNLDLSNNNVVSNDNVYVLINGQSSSPVTLNQNNSDQNIDLTINVGETINIPIIPVNGNVSIAHSSSTVASTTQSGNSINIKGMNAGTDTITVTGQNSSGQTVSGTLIVRVVNNQNQNSWQGGSIFMRNFERYLPTQFQNKRQITKVKNYKNFWDKKLKITFRNYHNNNYNYYRNFGR